ncbi:MAG: hypothetical protein AABY00_03115 [Nanoarchaeota archaeon]
MNQLSADIEKNILKSGTSIVGIVCKDGVVLAGDRRTTAGGQIVMSKKSDKVVPINDFIVVAGTGVAADIDLSQRVFAAELRLKELKTKSRVTVKEAANLFGLMCYRNIRTPSMIPSVVGMLLAGVNEDGSTQLYTIEPAGGTYKVDDYDANFGSGMPYILGLLERQYKKEMSIKDGVELAKECIKSAMERDPGSGNGIDVFTVTKDGVRHVVSEQIVVEYK